MVQRYNILGRYTNQYLCLCSRAWSVEVSHGKIRVRPKSSLFSFSFSILFYITYKREKYSIGDRKDDKFLPSLNLTTQNGYCHIYYETDNSSKRRF